jgi:hypothetical protein
MPSEDFTRWLRNATPETMSAGTQNPPAKEVAPAAPALILPGGVSA